VNALTGPGETAGFDHRDKAAQQFEIEHSGLLLRNPLDDS
jgi:hypothetical protein